MSAPNGAQAEDICEARSRGIKAAGDK